MAQEIVDEELDAESSGEEDDGEEREGAEEKLRSKLWNYKDNLDVRKKKLTLIYNNIIIVKILCVYRQI